MTPDRANPNPTPAAPEPVMATQPRTTEPSPPARHLKEPHVIENLPAATPVEIDTALVQVLLRLALAESHLSTATKRAQAGADYLGPERAAALRAEVSAAEQLVAGIAAEASVLDAEYERRGGWQRYWLVRNHNGHVHRTTNCPTTYTTTQFVWLPDFADRTDGEVVQAAGSLTCLTRFPGVRAEILARRPTIEDPERRAAHDEREAAKAERAAKREAKAITNPDGTPLVVTDPWSPGGQTLATLNAARTWLTDSQETWRNPPSPDEVQRVATALAAKLGTTPHAEITAAAKRASRRK